MNGYKIILLFSFSFAIVCNGDMDLFPADTKEVNMNFNLTSPVFNEGESIPSRYTCDGINISPPLMWTDPPKGTGSFALIVDDPDAPAGNWVHWIVFNLPANLLELPENFSPHPSGASTGVNDFRKTNYGGPCPPSGTHRYFFKLYSLDITLPLKEGATKKQLLESMKEHILAKAVLYGIYKRRS